jgi:CRP-like cAMP-binding protein
MLQMNLLKRESIAITQLRIGARVQPALANSPYAHVLRCGVISTSIPMYDGNAVGVGLSSRGDLLELDRLLGVPCGERSMAVLVPGELMRIPFDALEKAFCCNEEIRSVIHQLAIMQTLEAQHLAVCNCLHQVNARLARYLLTVSDLSACSRMQITQETLARELGTRRSTIVLAMTGLKTQGMIEHKRGTILIRDHSMLQACSCECYGALQKMRNGLQPAPTEWHSRPAA